MKSILKLAFCLVSFTVCHQETAIAGILESYTVKEGDTACDIAEQYGIPCVQLIKKNSLGDNALIFPGQVLKIPDSSMWNDSMPCKIEVISWVNVTVVGDYLKENKQEFEKFVRNKLRLNSPWLSHEARDYGSFWADIAYDDSAETFIDVNAGEDERFMRRAEVDCKVLSSGTDSVVPIYTACEVFGWGDYSPSTYSEFRLESLSTATVSNLPAGAETMLGQLLSEISGRLMDYRQKECPGIVK
ncbi:MAG: hypothetical protein CL398_04275 [Acidiferrobacteraceae bacterium]|nr:hypothetical protein [Acidiferrobacteraceae bacterium]|tara:strand:- start:2088 stop:2819 length:732 start_codon:yes stop_codon:yes gene_type:complete